MKKIFFLTIIFILLLVGIVYAKDNNIKWKDNCQTKCIDNKCSIIIGKTIYVNDSDNQCKPVEEAQSLKNSPIKAVVTSDGYHFAEVIDYNATSIKLKTSIKDKIQKKDIPIKVYKKVFDEETKEFIKTENVDKKKSLSFNAKNDLKEQENVFQVNFFNGEELHIGEESTIVILNDSTENVIDIKLRGTSGLEDYSYGMFKFNITQLTEISNITIEYANLYIYAHDIYASWNGQIISNRVDNQTWTAASTASVIDSLPLTNSKNFTNKWTVDGGVWDFINVTDMVYYDVNAGNNFTSIKVAPNTTKYTISSVTDDDEIEIGNSYTSVYCQFRTQGYAVNTSMHPYLEVSYTIPAADTCTYSGTDDWLINASDSCNLVVTNLLKNNVVITGSGTVIGTRNLTNYTIYRIENGAIARN